MKKKLFSMILAAAIALSLPAAAFASDTLVDAEGNPVSNSVFDDGWEKAGAADLIDFAAMEALAAASGSVEVEQGVAEDLMGVKVDTSAIGTDRTSNTSGTVSAHAAFTKTANTAKCNILLQVKSDGSWITASNLPVYSYTKTVYNQSYISAAKTFTLKSGKVYRAKITFVDTNSSGTYTSTRYTGSF